MGYVLSRISQAFSLMKCGWHFKQNYRIEVILSTEYCTTYFQARDFDPDSLRSGLPKAVSSLEWAISEGNGRVYVHCTAGLGRAPAVAIAYMFWFCNMDVSQ